MLAHRHHLEPTPEIERRAGRIEDPVRRLRYLRRAMAIPPPLPAPVSTPAPPAKIRRKSLIPRAIGIAAAVAILFVPTPAGTAETSARERGLLIPRDAAAPSLPKPVPKIWTVERTDTTEVFSNGLRVDLTYAVSNRPRAAFPVFPLTGDFAAARTRITPVGIVYHTTESHLAPFEEDENRRLRQLGRNLLEWVRQERAYHYVIDRFGRVYRVVAESDAANHAGNSVWADADGIYVNLNDSFLGISFEGQTGARDEVTPAQIASAKVLTEMLRSRYSIPAENCVTHAQVSVNPVNMHIGAHTDWAADFPFAALGLPDNYSISLPSVWTFGFDYDDAFLRVTGNGWKGLFLAAAQVERQASAQHLPLERYRAMLQRRFKDIAADLKQGVTE